MNYIKTGILNVIGIVLLGLFIALLEYTFAVAVYVHSLGGHISKFCLITTSVGFLLYFVYTLSKTLWFDVIKPLKILRKR